MKPKSIMQAAKWIAGGNDRKATRLYPYLTQGINSGEIPYEMFKGRKVIQVRHARAYLKSKGRLNDD